MSQSCARHFDDDVGAMAMMNACVVDGIVMMASTIITMAPCWSLHGDSGGSVIDVLGGCGLHDDDEVGIKMRSTTQHYDNYIAMVMAW